MIDDSSGAVIGKGQLLPGDLPETFELETTLHLGESQWLVVQAEPQTRAEYAKSGTLVLRVLPIEQIDLSNILYSLPSICVDIPPVGDLPLTGDECMMHEDDWRQLEFVSRQLATEADAEIAAIRLIHEQERESDSGGWRNIHVRRRPDPPIIGPLTRERLEHAFGELNFHGVGCYRVDSPIASGFAFTAADGLTCYGLEDEGRLTVLGVVQDDYESPPVKSADALAQIAREFDLDLVHWCRCERASPDSPQFRSLLLE